MAVLVAAGFERGTHLGLVTGNANNKYMDRTAGTLGTNVEVVSAAARTGGYGLRLTAAAATVFCGFANNGQGGVLGTSAVIVQSFWFRIPSLPGANAIVWSSFGTVGGADMALRFVQSTGTLNAEVGASTITGPSISANTWYHVDLKADYGVNPHTLDWRIDGAAQTQVTAALAAEQIFIAGWGLDNAAQTITFHVDDTLMSITAADYPLGKHKVVQLVPDTGDTAAEIGTANSTRRYTANATADGSFNSANILTAISEVPPLIGATATGVCQVTSGTGNALGIPFTTYTLGAGETVSGLRICVVGWAATTTSAAIGLRTFNGTTETTLFTSADPNFDASTTAPAGLCKMATLANFDTQGEIDALVVRLGYSADVSPIIGAHAVYAELAVKEATSTTWNADAALAATGTLAATGASDKPVSAALSGTGTLAATGSSTKPVDSGLAATASLTAAATPVRQADAGLAATAPLAATVSVTRPIDAALPGSASLAATAASTKPVDAATAATATLVAAAAATKATDATLAATATVSAAASTTRPVDAALTGTTALTASSSTIKPVDGSLTATGSLVADTSKATNPAASLAATATATATASRDLPGNAALSATAALTATATVDHLANASLAVTATAAADTSTVKPVAASLMGVASVTSAADVSGQPVADAALATTAVLATAANATKPVDAALAATAGLASAGVVTSDRGSTMSATATVSSAASVTKPVDSTLAAVATLAAAANVTGSGASANLTATGTVTADAQVTKPVTATVSVTATLTATASVVGPPQVDANAALTSTAALTASGASVKPGGADVSAVAVLAATAEVIHNAAAHLLVTVGAAAGGDVPDQITLRPNEGTTPRTASGTTGRPDTGRTERL